MDQNLYKIVSDNINRDLIDIIISNPPLGSELKKVKIRPVLLKGKLTYQSTEYRGNQVFHSNHTRDELLVKLDGWLTNFFKQILLRTKSTYITGLISKKGKATVKVKNCLTETERGNHFQENGIGQIKKNKTDNNQTEMGESENCLTGNAKAEEEIHRQNKTENLITKNISADDTKEESINTSIRARAVYHNEIDSLSDNLLSHNREKTYILKEGCPVPFLIDLGVMTTEGKVIKARYDKYKQINRFLEFIEDVLPAFNKDKELTIIDFGCGKSYLTFAIYYFLKILRGYQVQIIGLDLKKDVIRHCNQLAEKYGYDKLTFLEGDIASYQGMDKVDMVVTLHACDTATDYALYKAIVWDADVILSVPCCQHELNGQMKNDLLKPIIQYGLIKERMAALITDAFRADLLEVMGYKTQILEFIDMEHTPKNILIRAVKKTERKQLKGEKLKSYEACRQFLGVEPAFYKLLTELDPSIRK